MVERTTGSVHPLSPTLNYSHHFGMQKVTTTTTKRIYSASNSSMPLAIYQPVGKGGRDDVYIYNTKVKQKTPNHTQANEYTTSRIKWTNGSTPQLVTTETRWQYRNDFYNELMKDNKYETELSFFENEDHQLQYKKFIFNGLSIDEAQVILVLLLNDYVRIVFGVMDEKKKRKK